MTSSTKVVELPPEYATADVGRRPAYLYRFSVELAGELNTWTDTSFAWDHHGRLRGVGVDCVQLLGLILVEVGALAGYEFPPCVPQGGGAKPLPGDMLYIRIRRPFVPHHCGLVVDAESFIHAVPSRGVIESPIRERVFAKRT